MGEMQRKEVMGTPDDAWLGPEDIFLSHAISNAVERMPEWSVDDFDVEAGVVRFRDWLERHTEEVDDDACSDDQVDDHFLAKNKNLTVRRPGGSTASRLIVGGSLRMLREAAGLTLEQAAEMACKTRSKVVRIEDGRCTLELRDIVDLLAVYGVGRGRKYEALLRVVRDSRESSLWEIYQDSIPSWAEVYAFLERATSSIRTCEFRRVPDLLQTESYARALGAPDGQDLATRVRMLHVRQEILRTRRSPRFWVVIDESVLLRLPGNRPVMQECNRIVMREQLQYLIDMCGNPAVTIQILPLSSNARPETGTSFTILGYADPNLRDTVYTEQLTSVQYLDRPTDVGAYEKVFEQASLMARDAWDTPDRLKALLEET